MKLTLGFSPCPNDTFIFDALVNSKIDTEGFEFEPVLEDVQTLNGWAAEGRLDITKLSFPALLQNAQTYSILSSGAALGKGVGPLLIAKKAIDVENIAGYKVAIPGINTTANFLLQHAFPTVQNRVPTLFSDIEDAVLNGTVDLGVIIHENRFTYQQKGLVKIADLGEMWEERTGAAIPLGCIAAKKSLGTEVRQKVDELIRKSLLHSFHDYPAISGYVKQHAQAMDEAVMRQHIELYVNDFSVDLGEEGQKAINLFARIYSQQSGEAAVSLFE
ncbi:MAG: 1,4-dihydroxy-6-naphthoate synthase [Flaviaesturariibacter sp.]|nr:1,4-dihydroxy-6-naphthoate synthase [Flaviaesturariibacter sp.]